MQTSEPTSVRPAAGRPQPPRAEWLARLASVRLPWLSPAPSLQRALGAHISVRELLGTIEADLPLAVEVIASAGQTLRHSGQTVQGLQHAVNLLGIERVQGLIRARRHTPLDPTQPAHQAVLQAMATTRLACLFTNHWTALRTGADPEPPIWATALLGVVRWKLPLLAPREAAEIERRVAAGQRRVVAERELLGVDVDDLTADHLGALGLPHRVTRLSPWDIAQAARCARTGDAAPELSEACQRALQQPGVVSGLAQSLAQSVQDSWYSRRTRTWMAVAAGHLNRPLDRLRADLVQLALHASREATFTRGLVAPASRLLWEAPAPRRVRPRAVAPAPAPAPVAAPPAAQPQDLRELFSGAVRELTQHLGLRRCALFLTSSDGQRLGCAFAHGFDGTALVRGLAMPVSDPHLPQRMLRQAAGLLWVRDAQVATARQQMPAGLAPLVPASGMLLGVVMVDGRPRGLWWADTGNTGRALDADTSTAFRAFTQRFGAGFDRLTRAQPPHAASRPAALAETA